CTPTRPTSPPRLCPRTAPAAGAAPWRTRSCAGFQLNAQVTISADLIGRHGCGRGCALFVPPGVPERLALLLSPVRVVWLPVACQRPGEGFVHCVDRPLFRHARNRLRAGFAL